MPSPGQPRPRGSSIRGSPVDPDAHKLPLPHGGVWSGRVWPDPQGPRPTARMPIIVCFGDSHTQGQLGADYVGLLRAKFQGQLRFVNCGTNGHVLER
jgi:hypothetical protein